MITIKVIGDVYNSKNGSNGVPTGLRISITMLNTTKWTNN